MQAQLTTAVTSIGAPASQTVLSLSRHTAILFGGLAASLGILALIGSAAHAPRLAQIFPDLPAMPWIDAACCILAGLVLAGIASGRSRFVPFGCALTACVAAASLIERVMSPATAICFLILAAGFFMTQARAGRRSSQRSFTGLGIAGLLVMAISASWGVSAVWGGGDTFGWGGLSMALHTAAALMLLGIGSFAIALDASLSDLQLPKWAPIGAGLFLMTVRLGLLRAFSPRHQTSVSVPFAFFGSLLGAVVFGTFVHLALKTHLQRNLLRTANRRLGEEMLERQRAEGQEQAANERLERRVEERTGSLEAANEELRREIARRERVEEDLRKQKEILQTIFDHVPVAINFLDEAGRFQLVNREWERIVGFKLEQVVGQGVDLISEGGIADPAERQRAMDLVANSTSEWEELEVTTQDGGVKHSTWAVVRLSDGARIGIGQDITERKQAEQELRRQKEILQTIFDHVPVGIDFIDEAGRIQVANREWERIIGHKLEEIVGQGLDVIVEGGFADPIERQRALDFVANSTSEWEDFEVTTADGGVKHSTWAVVRLSDGARIGIGQDITERKQAEQELRKQKEILQTIFDHLPVMVGFVDENGWPRMANRQWERTLGWSLEEIHSQNIDLLAENYPDPGECQQARDFVRNCTAEWQDFKTKVRDGRVMDTSWAMLRLSDGTAIGIGQDITERKQAERELRRQKEILQTIFDHIPLMINFGDGNFHVQLVNREWERTLGWSLEDLRGNKVDILAENYPDPEYRERVRDFVMHSNGEWRDFKTRVRDGRVIDTSWVMLHLPDGISIGIGQDITRRKQAEEALRESEGRFRQFAENIQDLFWIKTPDFKRTLYLSPAYTSISGRSPEERYRDVDYHPFLNIIHPEDREKMERIIESGLGAAFDVEFRIFRADGAMRWIRDRGFPIRDQSGRIFRIAGIASDITERKLAEEALRESEERFRQLTENIREVFWLMTPDFQKVLYLSPAFESLIGEPPGSRLRYTELDPLAALTHPDDVQRVREGFKGRGEEFDIEYRILRRDGSVRWVRVRGFPIRDESGVVRRVGGVAEDITERKEAEERLKATSEQLRALSNSLQSAREEEATRIAHQIHDDMGGVLTALRWELESLAKLVQESGDLCSFRSAMTKKVTAMLGLTDTTINVVRRIASELRPSILDDLGLVEAIEWQAQQFQARTGIECRCDFATLGKRLNDRQSTAVFRIFQEALTNILRHAQASHVDVAIREDDRTLLLTVSDNGRGITQAEKLGRGSLGILGMQERARLIGGRVDILGREDTGTNVYVQIPIEESEPGGAG